jgi:hypothetical protein
MAPNQQKYMQWQLIAPPATRFFQLADGNFSLYFEKTKIAAMVEWAESQVDAFRRLATFIAQQEVESQQAVQAATQAAIDAEEAEGTEAEPAPIAPNIKSTPAKKAPPQPQAKSQTARGNETLRKLGLGLSPQNRPKVGNVELTTQEEIKKEVPIAPPPKPKPDLSNDPGLAIALAQQRRIDASKGIDREAKNNAPDEEVQEEIPQASGEPQEQEEEAPTEEGTPVITSNEVQ